MAIGKKSDSSDPAAIPPEFAEGRIGTVRGKIIHRHAYEGIYQAFHSFYDP